MSKPLKYAEARIVEPFSIQFDGAIPSATAKVVSSVPQYQSSSAARYVHLDPGQESQNNALMESRILNDTIRENTRDGNLLNIATTYSVFSNSSIIIIILLTSKVN